MGQKLLKLADLKRLGSLVTASAAASVIPHRYDAAVVDWLRSKHKGAQAEYDRIAGILRSALPERKGVDWDALAEQFAQMSMEDTWARFRGMGLRGWHPEIEFEGIEHLERAKARGKGAVVWCMRFSSATALKQGFHKVGHPLCHLSMVQHGTTTTSKFALKVVGPMFCRAERPYLAERILIPLGSGLRYVEQIRGHLAGNQLVSIFPDKLGRQVVEVPFLTGRRKYATGAPSFAWTANSVLLSAYAIRTGPSRYRVVVEPPISLDRSLTRKEAAERAVIEFGRRSERIVRRYPADWQMWVDWDRAQQRLPNPTTEKVMA